MKNKKAFSLVEILVALIIVSLITAALAPVITKKLSSAGVTIVGGGSGPSVEIPDENVEVEKCEKEIPEYTYKTSSGTNVTTNTSYIKIESDSTYWKIKFLKSGVFELKNADFTIDAFAVGGGAGGGNYGGGGGGYTVTKKSIAAKKEVAYTITVGDGGAAKTNGNASYIAKKSDGTKLINASGGKYSSSGGGNGGSGGAGGGSGNCKAGAAGSNGGDGKKTTSGCTNVYPGGEGQGTTTREFGLSTGTLYSGGGGGSTGNAGGCTPGGSYTSGGSGGGGRGGSHSGTNGGNGSANTGGGGGDGCGDCCKPGKGGSGIVIIKGVPQEVCKMVSADSSSSTISTSCSTISAKCTICNISKKTCLSCEDGYILSGGKCIEDDTTPKWDACVDIDENCSVCTSEKCLSCTAGYYVDTDGNCAEEVSDVDKECSTLDANCILCSKNVTDGICYQCKDGYTLDNGVCLEEFRIGEPQKQADCDPYFAWFVPKEVNGAYGKNICITTRTVGYHSGPEVFIGTYDSKILTDAGAECTHPDKRACCWRGNITGGFYGSVCGFTIASSSCKNYNPDFSSWNLPREDLVNAWIDSYSTNDEFRALIDGMFCVAWETFATEGRTMCETSYKCIGAPANECIPARIWARNGQTFELLDTLKWMSGSTEYTAARAFCVSSNVPIR